VFPNRRGFECRRRRTGLPIDGDDEARCRPQAQAEENPKRRTSVHVSNNGWRHERLTTRGASRRDRIRALSVDAIQEESE